MTLELAVTILVVCMVALGIIIGAVHEIIRRRLNKAINMIDKNEIYINYANSNIHELELFLHKKLADAPSAKKIILKDDDLLRNIQNDLYQLSAKYNVCNQQDYFIVMGIYLSIELITANYANKADGNAEYQVSKMFLHDPVEVDRIFKKGKGDS